MGGNASINIDELLKAREEHRKNKRYAKADQIKKVLLDNDIRIEDTPWGPRYKKDKEWARTERQKIASKYYNTCL